jgi:hypothetical protein
MTHTPKKLKNASLTLSCLVVTTCLTMPIIALADTSTSVGAIMEQMKSFKPPAPKPVSTPTVTETPIETKKERPITIDPVPVAIEPTKIETKQAPTKEPVTSSVYVAPPQTMAVQETPIVTEQKIAKPRPVTRKKRRAKKKITRRARPTTTKQNSAVDYKGFDERYMSLINDILNDKKPAKRATTTAIDANTLHDLFSGTGGWIYLGKHNAGRWLSGKTLKVGNTLPQVGQQYTVKSPLLNLRKTRPIKGGLGKLVQVLRVGDRVHIKQIHRSVKNNYWANIVRP